LATYSKETITQVLTSTDIVDVVGRVLELKPSSGGRFLALCPFHNEKTPSFTVSRDRQSFHCFGCGKGGDAISFLQEYDGLSFTESLLRLAESAGVQLPEKSDYDAAGDKQRKSLLDINSFAARFYFNTLNDPLKGGKARKYLKERNLKPETLKRFGLGYAPETGALLSAAKTEGYKEYSLEAAGLVRRGDRGDYYDFFRDRLMVPIRDTSGRVVAFGGRDLGGKSPAKYVNTPENELYKKSRVLYGLSEARDAMRREKKAILVEGYFDLMRPFDVGIENVVATCGTALTNDQAKLVKRYVPEVVIVYDGDRAGIQAALRGVSILTAVGLTVKALTLPEGMDPDDFIVSEGKEAFRELLENAQDFVTFYAAMNADKLQSIEGKTDVARELFTIIASLDDELRRDEYLKRTARVLDLNEWSVRAEYDKRTHSTRRRTPINVREKTETGSQSFNKDDCDFLAAILTIKPLHEKAKQMLSDVQLPQNVFGEILARVFCGCVARNSS